MLERKTYYHLRRELNEAKNVLLIVLNGGIDEELDWQQVMNKVRDIVKPPEPGGELPGKLGEL